MVPLSTPLSLFSSLPYQSKQPRQTRDRIAMKLVGPNRWFLLILGLSLIRGMVYATCLPPWGLNDEQQHFHYIQSICETGSPPIVGRDYISDEIALSSYETRRREAFHWPPYPSVHPQDWGLEGHSYEGYQPPLYYFIMAPVYCGASLISSSTLMRLQILKWANVLLASVTLCLLCHIANLLFPKERLAPFLMCSLLIWWPERVMSTSRVNNDVLTEVMGSMLYVLLTKSALKDSISKRDCLWIGVVFGLGLLTKLTFLPWVFGILYVLWLHRKDSRGLGLLLVAGISVIIIIPYAVRNILIYGDPTGFSSFQRLAGPVSAPERTSVGVFKAITELGVYLWVVWWKGAMAGGGLVVRSVFCLYFALLYSIVALGLTRLLRSLRRYGRPVTLPLVLSFIAVGAFLVSTMSSYYTGRIPILQGRFMLPVAIPLIALMGFALFHIKRGGRILASLILALAAIDMTQLFGNLLPYFYYWSAFTTRTSEAFPNQSIGDIWGLFVDRFLADKPQGLQWLIVGLVTVYIFMFMKWALELKRCWHADSE